MLACLGVHLEQGPPSRRGLLQPKRREPLHKKSARRPSQCAGDCPHALSMSGSTMRLGQDRLRGVLASRAMHERERHSIPQRITYQAKIRNLHRRFKLMQRTIRESMTNFLGTRGSYILSLSPLQYSNLNIRLSSCCLSPCLVKPLLFKLHNSAFATPAGRLIHVSHKSEGFETRRKIISSFG